MKNKTSLIKYGAIALALLAAAAPGFAADFDVYPDGKRIYVKDSFTGKTAFKSEDAAEAIQHALDAAAEDGGSVSLSSGRFYLDAPLKVASDVALSGSGRATKLEVTAENEEGIGIIAKDTMGVSVSDLCLTAGDNEAAKIGIVLDNCGNARVSNIFAVAFSEYGLAIQNKSFLSEIVSCVFAGNKKANIYGKDLNWGDHGDFIPNLISNCTIYGGGKGIELDFVIVMNIVGCNIYQTNDIGIHIYNQSNSVAVVGSRTFQISADAVVVHNSHELNITGNVFCWHTGNGIVIEACAWGVISGNEVIDNGSYNPGGDNFKSFFKDLNPDDIPLTTAIILDQSRGYTVSNNTIFNWRLAPKMEYGIHEKANSFKNLIQGNNINYFLEAAIKSEGAETLVANNVELADVTHAEIGKFHGHHRIEGKFLYEEKCQSYQPELTQQLIDTLR